MTDSERIAELERELAQLRDWVIGLIDSHQQIGGQHRATQAAILALSEHQAGPTLSERMQRHLLKVGAQIVAESLHESHVAAFQGAEATMLLTSSVPRKPDPV